MMDDGDRRLLSASIGLAFAFLVLKLLIENLGKIVLIVFALACLAKQEKPSESQTSGRSPPAAAPGPRR